MAFVALALASCTVAFVYGKRAVTTLTCENYNHGAKTFWDCTTEHASTWSVTTERGGAGFLSWPVRVEWSRTDDGTSRIVLVTTAGLSPVPHARLTEAEVRDLVDVVEAVTLRNESTRLSRSGRARVVDGPSARSWRRSRRSLRSVSDA